MSRFYYEAVSPDGQKSKGTLDAASRSKAVEDLANRGLKPFVLEDRGGGGGSSGKAKAKTAQAASKGKVTLKTAEVIEFTEELSDLLRAGMQLEPALASMAQREENSPLKRVCERALASLREGVSFADSLRQASPSFGELYCTLAHAGEVSGALPSILRRQAEHLKVLQELRGRVVNSLIYPAFLMVSGIGVCILFMAFLVPRFSDMIARSDTSLPPMVHNLMAISQFIQQQGWFVLAALVGLVVVIWRVLALPQVRPARDRLQLRLPFSGPMLRLHFQVRFLETMANLVGNGLPLLRSLQLVRDSTQNRFLRGKLDTCVDQVSDGMSLSRSLQLSGVFPRQLTDMLRVGEQTGEMGSAMGRIAEKYDRELNQKIGSIGAMIQPVIIMIVAGLVGTMAYIMISVIYDMVATLRAQ